MSTYTTKYLKADSYNSFFDACDNAGLVADGEIVTSCHNHSLVLIGEIYKETGEITESGDKERKSTEGYHANLRFKNDVGLSNLEIEVCLKLKVNT